jgi:hypothetical protein
MRMESFSLRLLMAAGEHVHGGRQRLRTRGLQQVVSFFFCFLVLEEQREESQGKHHL